MLLQNKVKLLSYKGKYIINYTAKHLESLMAYKQDFMQLRAYYKANQA